MIGWATVTTEHEVDLFQCPVCAAERSYARCRVRRYATLLGKPLLPVALLGEYFECQTCLTAFEPEVIDETDPERARQATAYLRAVRLVLAHMVAIDGAADAVEIATAQKVYRGITGYDVDTDVLLREARQAMRSANPVRAVRPLIGHLNDEGRRQVVRAAAQVAMADGKLHDAEQMLLFRVGAALGLDDVAVRALLKEELDRFFGRAPAR